MRELRSVDLNSPDCGFLVSYYRQAEGPELRSLSQFALDLLSLEVVIKRPGLVALNA